VLLVLLAALVAHAGLPSAGPRALLGLEVHGKQADALARTRYDSALRGTMQKRRERI
jgi:hypothetical protein